MIAGALVVLRALMYHPDTPVAAASGLATQTFVGNTTVLLAAPRLAPLDAQHLVSLGHDVSSPFVQATGSAAIYPLLQA